MKQSQHIAVIGLVAILTLVVGISEAQFPPVPGDNSDDTASNAFSIPVSEGVTGDMTQTAPTGALVKQSNGLYVLIMEQANTTTTWQHTAPTAQDGTIETNAIARGWREQKGLRGQGTLKAGNLELRLVLMTPFLNPETGILTYTVMVSEIVQPQTDDPTSVLLNRTFDSGGLELTVDLNTEFLNLLAAGVNASVANQRDCECPPGTPGFLCEICESGGL